jgi:hypothetical protein
LPAQLIEFAGRPAAKDDEFELLLCSGSVAGIDEAGGRVYVFRKAWSATVRAGILAV